MSESETDNIACYRKYLTKSDGDVHLCLHKPVRYTDEEYGCRLTIKGAGFDLDKMIRGFDSLQCMILALSYAHSELTLCELYEKGELFWFEPDPDLGIPFKIEFK